MQNVSANVSSLLAQHDFRTEPLSALLPHIEGALASDSTTLPQLFENLFQFAPIGIAVGGADYRFIKVNRALSEFVQIPESELVGKDFRSITHPDDLLLTIDKHRLLIQGKQGPVTFEKRYIRGDGEIAWGQVTTTILRDERGTFICSISMVVDITARKIAEQQLHESNENLSLLNRELERFAVLASHDLREPLRTISQFLQLLKMRYSSALPDEGNEFVEISIQSASRLELMVRSILTLTEMRISPSRFERVSARTMLQNAMTNLNWLLKESSAKVVFGQMPEVSGVPCLLTEVFQNLIENSIKYRSHNPPYIDISWYCTEGEFVFSVRDNGIGFSNEDAQKLFQPFERLGQTGSGSGIGLSLCRKIIEAHGGRIWVESSTGVGTTAFFSVPAVPM